jgi:hypothetical protein
MMGTQHHAACIVVSRFNLAEVPVFNSTRPTWIGRGQSGQGITSLSLAGLGRHVSREHVELQALPAGQGGAVVTATVAGARGIWVKRAGGPLLDRAFFPQGSSLEVSTRC